MSKLRLAGEGAGALSPKGGVTKTAGSNLSPFLSALINPGPCLLLALSSTCVSGLYLLQKATSLPLCSTSKVTFTEFLRDP